MSKLIVVALNDLRIFFTSRANLIGLLAIPIAMTIILGIFISGDSGPSRVRLDIIDHDGGDIAAQFLQSLREANSSIVLCPMDNDVEDFCDLGDEQGIDLERGRVRVAAGDSLALLEIPAGFSQRVAAFQQVSLRFLSVDEFTGPSFVRQAVDTARTRVNGAVVASRVGAHLAAGVLANPAAQEGFAEAVYRRASALWDEKPVRVDFQLTAEEATDPTQALDIGGFGQSVPGMGSMFVMFTVLGGMATLVSEKKQWTLQRLAMMPIARAQLLGGKILARFALGMIQYGVVFAVGVFAGLNFGRDPLALLLIMAAFTLAVTALSFALGSQLKSEQQAAGLTNLLGLTLAPLGGSWWPLEIVPNFMRIVGHISPVAWAMDGYASLMFRNGDLGSVWVSIVVLLGMSALFFTFGIWRFRYD